MFCASGVTGSECCRGKTQPGRGSRVHLSLALLGTSPDAPRPTVPGALGEDVLGHSVGGRKLFCFVVSVGSSRLPQNCFPICD